MSKNHDIIPVIIPVLNDEKNNGKTLHHATTLQGWKDIVVVEDVAKAIPKKISIGMKS